MSQLMVSVIIPTYQRRESARRALLSLAAQDLPSDRFDVVLVVDGSDDGTEAMALDLGLPYCRQILSQRNGGRASACNLGVGAVGGDLVVLLDDDMEAEPGLLSAHLAAHAASTDQPLGVLGAVPIVGDGYIAAKFNRHLAELAAEARVTGVRDVYTGNFSVLRRTFVQVGGFDEEFREYGNEDVDLGLRLRSLGVHLVYAPDAVARQHHAKGLPELARDAESKGRTAVLLASKHPSAWSELELGRYRRRSWRRRLAVGALLAAGRVVPRTTDVLVQVVASTGGRHGPERFLLDYCYWRGVASVLPIAEATIPPGPAAVVREDDRNRLLRRLDWRFVSPDPTLAGAEVVAGPELTLAVRLVAGPGPPGRLAVLEDPSASVLRRAAGGLEPGGILYVELARRVPGGALVTARRLERAGVEILAQLFVWPLPPRQPRGWLPLGAPGAVRWFVPPRHGAAGAADSLGIRAARAAWRFVAAAGALPPHGVLARKPGGGRHDRSGVIEPAIGYPLIVTAGHRSVGKVVVLTFPRGGDRPIAAVKYARTPEAEPSLDREAAALEAVARLRPELAGVPRVLFRRPWDGGRALGQSVAQGVALQRLLTGESLGRLADLMTAWVVDLAGVDGAVPASVWWERVVGSALQRFDEQFGAVADPGLMAVSQAALQQLPPLPLVVEHRDLAPWNVLLDDGGGLQVLDWESAETAGLPGPDLVYFLAFAGFAVDRAASREAKVRSYRRSHGVGSATGEVRTRCLDRYAAQLGVPPAALPALAVLTWLVHSRSDFRAITSDGGSPPDADALRSSTFFSLWQEATRHVDA